MEVAAGTSDAAVIDSLMAACLMVGEGTGYASLTYTCWPQLEEYGVGFRKGFRNPRPEAEQVLPGQLRRRLLDHADRRDLRRAGRHHRAEVIDTARDFR